ncbi:hypothetical protein SASPL_135465 [Salvia splendens]|uniref:Fatty acid omega-hydroxylase n=1 Tax=Salvia splendens TaxID=180675 RepID=A0A8X8X079_SALSN|nr:hypothetical protein SASPL_135465 [Salvia splendens]
MDFISAIFYIAAAAAAPLAVVALVSSLLIRIFVGKSIRNGDYPTAPVVGTVFDQLFYLNRLYDYQTEMAKKHKTWRLLAPDQSEVYTAEWRIFVVDGDKWRQQKKLASFEFSTRVLRDYSCSVFRQKAEKLVKTVQEFSKHNLSFDVQALLMRYTLDSIFTVGFGVDLNCLEESNAEGNEFIKAFDDSNELVYRRYVAKIKRYLNICGEATLKKNTIASWTEFLVESKKDPETMNNQYLRDIILSFMVAGKDTTANTLSWFLYMLCKNTLIQEKIAQEVRKFCSRNDATVSEFVESNTDEALNEMHYLHATITETLRLYPAVPVDGRCAETDDTLPDGYRLKRGDGVYYIAYAMGRMQYIWEDNAEEFKPERWLENGVFQPESPFKFVAFNAGPRTCLGKDFAYRQMKIVSAALLRFFRFRLSDDSNIVTYGTMLTLHISGSLNVYAEPRTNLLKM